MLPLGSALIAPHPREPPVHATAFPLPSPVKTPRTMNVASVILRRSAPVTEASGVPALGSLGTHAARG